MNADTVFVLAHVQKMKYMKHTDFKGTLNEYNIPLKYFYSFIIDVNGLIL